ncbi:MAG TPA: aspartate kinase [Cyclobacteriaceae bacterium]|nr:aspartate kinase [Cyclobacteriaceae bacterium]
MKVFKFGGASVKNAAAIQNVTAIVKQFEASQLLIVVSAIGKTTNALERVVLLARNQQNFETVIEEMQHQHQQIIKELGINDPDFNNTINAKFVELKLLATQPGEYDQVYDQVVSQGEVLSSLILNQYFVQQGLRSAWIDARHYIETDNTWREGKVDWEQSRKKIQSLKKNLQSQLLVTQGFIGGTLDNKTTTLGREGSDYSAAIFAACLSAESVTIWKDVPGVMSADPKRLPNAVVFDELPYQEAAEMTYYGASVIHPKTIKPLANAGIPLLVKNFDNPALPGTRIHECKIDKLPPLVVFKENQCLISCKVTDYSFVNEQQMSTIFTTLSQHDVHINVMQNSAISFSICVDYREPKTLHLIETLSKNFEVYYNTGLTLITIKNYDTATFNEYRQKPGILLEQSSRSTLQVLVRL